MFVMPVEPLPVQTVTALRLAGDVENPTQTQISVGIAMTAVGR